MNEWISVKDSLPEMEQVVLGCDQFGEMQVCRREQPWEGEPALWYFGHISIFFPKHWMLLPEPPNQNFHSEEILHMKCHSCNEIYLVFQSKAKEWSCLGCSLKEEE